ncbi:hypothetical protein KCTCHS21_60000 [Cohnella abietis]|uniref:Uncharacterized protein n=1 Tax=Cohnella abietis TaxID=2507935 RepID=A0A3T1DEL1_9BACL|nr:hypothetical protein KCTCHS21_60000 [Cohnella abietis]
MEYFFDLVQVALSLGLISSILFLPYTNFSIQDIRWSQDIATAGSTLFVSDRQPQPNGIQRWIARTTRRKEAPDEDANGPSTN